MPNDLVRDGNWSPEKKAELLADIWDGIERVDPNQLDPEQHELYETRRLRVAQTLDDNKLERDALASLDRLGSCAGIILQAREIGGLLIGTGKATAEDKDRAKRVIGFMGNHKSKVLEDARCLRYLLKNLWLVSTESYLFGGVRASLPEREETLLEILNLVETLGDLEGTLGDPRTLYLRAVLMWRLRREHPARELWHSLSQETEYSDPRRVVRHHVWTESGGRPKLFHGRIISHNLEGERARVQVEELRQEVQLLRRDFANQPWRYGANISGGFHVAFNFIGPIADPPR